MTVFSKEHLAVCIADHGLCHTPCTAANLDGSSQLKASFCADLPQPRALSTVQGAELWTELLHTKGGSWGNLCSLFSSLSCISPLIPDFLGNKETGMWEKGTLWPVTAPSLCSELEASTQSEQDTELSSPPVQQQMHR